MEKYLDMLKGKKTYLCAALMFCLGGAKALGWVDEGAYQTLLGLLGAMGLAALRASK